MVLIIRDAYGIPQDFFATRLCGVTLAQVRQVALPKFLPPGLVDKPLFRYHGSQGIPPGQGAVDGIICRVGQERLPPAVRLHGNLFRQPELDGGA